MPEIVKRAVVGGLLEQTIGQVLAAAEAGGFNRKDAHHSRTAGRLDELGWKIVSQELARTLERIEEAVKESEARIAEDPAASVLPTVLVMMQFVAAETEEAPPHLPARSSTGRAGEDVLGPIEHRRARPLSE
jgi:hypothetical protein